ncbi:MAG: protoporphyrinogen oxidase [Planctomycetota bacterium]
MTLHPPRDDVIVIGGGLAGLACATRLRELGHDPLVFEAGHRAGGVIDYEEVEGFSIEWGPNTVRGANAAAVQVADSLGLADERIAASSRARKRFILHPTRQRLVRISPLGLLFGPLLGLRSKLRMLTEGLRPGEKMDEADEETIAQFITRRYTREFADRIIGPVVSGIHGGDIDELSIAAAFPAINDMVRRHGSVTRAMIARMLGRDGKRDASYAAWRRRLYTYRGGFQRLISAMVAAMPAGRVVLRTAADHVIRDPATGMFEVLTRRLDDPDRTTELRRAHAVVLATPAHAAAGIVRDVDRRLATALGEIRYAPMAQVAIGLPRAAVGHPLDGFGFLVPRESGTRTLGCLFSSTLFPHRAPAGQVLLTAFVGGATDPEAAALDDESLIRLVLSDVQGPLRIDRKAATSLARVRRWHQAIPQYELGHSDRIAECAWAEERRPGLAFIGNYRDGIGVGDVIANATRRADDIARWLDHVKAMPDEFEIMDANAAPTEDMDSITGEEP